MEAFGIVVKNVIIFVLLAIPGYIMVKVKPENGNLGGALSKVLVSIGMPFLILSSVSKIQFTGETLWTIVGSAVIGIVFHYIVIYASKFVAGSGQGEKNAGISRFCMVFSNNGFLGLPLAMTIFGGDSPVLTGVIVVNIITNILMQTEGFAVISGEKQKFSWKILLNPLLISFVIGVIINLTNVFEVIPETVTYCTYLSGMVTPLSMIIIGIGLGKANLKKMFANGKMYYVSAMKLITLPVIIVGFLLVFRLFMNIPEEFIIGMFISFAMPTAGLAPVYAGMCGGDVENGVYYTMGSTILSVITIPILYLLLNFVL